MAGRFQGFAQEGLNFLQQVCIENDKAWFDEHRFIYERSLLTPFRALVDDLAPAMLEIVHCWKPDPPSVKPCRVFTAIPVSRTTNRCTAVGCG